MEKLETKRFQIENLNITKSIFQLKKSIIIMEWLSRLVQFFECHNCENFIASDYSDIIIRDKNFNVLKK